MNVGRSSRPSPLAVYLVVAFIIGLESLGISATGRNRLGDRRPAGLPGTPSTSTPQWVGTAAITGRGHQRHHWLHHRATLRHVVVRGGSANDSPSISVRSRGAGQSSYSPGGACGRCSSGRFVALLRILAGPLAGRCACALRQVLAANASGAVCWAAAPPLSCTTWVWPPRWLSRFSGWHW